LLVVLLLPPLTVIDASAAEEALKSFCYHNSIFYADANGIFSLVPTLKGKEFVPRFIDSPLSMTSISPLRVAGFFPLTAT
jgi:hypothetical protein